MPRKCAQQDCEKQGYERYSYQVYAGYWCDEHAYSNFRDQCGLSHGQGNPQELDEPLEPEEYYGMEKW